MARRVYQAGGAGSFTAGTPFQRVSACGRRVRIADGFATRRGCPYPRGSPYLTGSPSLSARGWLWTGRRARAVVGPSVHVVRHTAGEVPLPTLLPVKEGRPVEELEEAADFAGVNLRRKEAEREDGRAM